MKTKMTADGLTELTSQEVFTTSGALGVLTDPFRPLPIEGENPLRLTRDGGGGTASISRLRDRGVPLDTLCDLFSAAAKSKFPNPAK
ncbi:hypothetical protein EHS39_36530 [Ensifer sp. MPMI2T]|nr:hypothetical protein EHS39_36530 [Ensifer sp. MPMI2T]